MYYYLFILAIGVERLIELVVGRRNAKWSFARGGKEFGRDHYPAMVSMHALLLVSCIVEVWALGRPFIPWLGWSMLAVVPLTLVFGLLVGAVTRSIASEPDRGWPGIAGRAAVAIAVGVVVGEQDARLERGHA